MSRTVSDHRHKMWLINVVRITGYTTILICPIVFVSYLYNSGLLSGFNYTNSNVSATFLNRIERAGYPAELHTVYTEDLYILGLLRIPHGRKMVADGKPRIPVFLMHPFMESSNAWIVQGPNKALAYLLADAGYDVWLGNARGTELSRKHANWTSDTESFWEYSWQDIGQKDLPAFINYILAKTRFSQLTYIGFSQGTTAFLALTSTRPEFNAKINHAHLMAPVAFLKDSGDKFYKTMSSNYPQLRMICHDLNIFRITLDQIDILKKIEMLCHRMYSKSKSDCSYFNWFVGYDGVNPEIVPTILQHMPAGVSLEQIFHFGQLMRSGKFQQFDYDNETINMQRYGEKSPPEFDLTQITTDISIYLSKNDVTTTYDNVMELKGRLTTAKDTFVVPHFKHSDFVYNDNAADVLYRRVIANIKRADETFTLTKSDEPTA